MLFPIRWLSGFLLLGLFFTAEVRLPAQSASEETLQQRITPQLRPGQSLPNASDQDLGQFGAVQKYPVPPMLTFSTSQDVFYLDNVFYADSHPLGSAAYFGNYAATYIPYSWRTWVPSITAQYNMVRYDRVSAADFDNEQIAFSSQYFFTDDQSWAWTSSIALSYFTIPHAGAAARYHESSFGHEGEVIYNNEIAHSWQPIKDQPFFLVAAYGIAYRQFDPSVFDRLDNTLAFSAIYHPIPGVSIGPFVRPADRIYTTNTSFQHDRNDFNLTEGLDVSYTPIKYFLVSADVTRTDDYSNAHGLSYSDTLPGFSLTGTVSY